MELKDYFTTSRKGLIIFSMIAIFLFIAFYIPMTLFYKNFNNTIYDETYNNLAYSELSRLYQEGKITQTEFQEALKTDSENTKFIYNFKKIFWIYLPYYLAIILITYLLVCYIPKFIKEKRRDKL